MINLGGVKSSAMVVGEYERSVTEAVKAYFTSRGYKALPHARFNVAWSANLSDVDLVVTNDRDLIAVEVKSKRDKLSRGQQQLNRIRHFVDFVYLASERLPRQAYDNGIGILLVRNGHVERIKEAERISSAPRPLDLARLQRICLTRIVNQNGKGLGKSILAELALKRYEPNDLRECLKEVVTCSRLCDSDCPIWKYQSKILR